jgi:guanosine-3',5'-bis(diphosphate) 3'-pyrophosphohydrolase
MKLASLDDLLAEIGLGNAMSVVVAKNLQQGEAAAAPVPANASNHGHLPIKGADGVLITFAKCCRPIPGDPIIAHVSPAKGWLSTMNPVVTFAATRKSRRSLWRLSGIKRPLRNSSPKSRWICLTTRAHWRT